MSLDYNWTDDEGNSRRSSEVFSAADVTDEILGLARALEDEWFSRDQWIDWSSFFGDLNCAVIPSSGRELDVRIEPGSPAMDRIQRHIRRHRMASIARWNLTADGTPGIDIAEPFLSAESGTSTLIDHPRSTVILNICVEAR